MSTHTAAHIRTGRKVDHPATGGTGNQSEVASWRTLSADRAVMARRSGLDTLGYLREMVRLEAEGLSRHGERKNGGR